MSIRKLELYKKKPPAKAGGFQQVVIFILLNYFPRRTILLELLILKN